MCRAYDHRKYWDAVAEQISKRERDGKAEFAAGSSMPVYDAQHRTVLESLARCFYVIPKYCSVLEFGCGPGGNLRFLYDRGFSHLTGFDTSPQMLSLAKLNCPEAELYGTLSTLEECHYDVTLIVTVLEHIVDHQLLASSLDVVKRITRRRVVLVEDVCEKGCKERTWEGRSAAFYCDALSPEFRLVEQERVGIPLLRHMIVISTMLGLLERGDDGDPVSLFTRYSQKLLLLTVKCCGLAPPRDGLQTLVFERPCVSN
jgi:SAM-dependent methyltransferase